MVVTEKKHTWVKSCWESAKRETEMFKVAESMADDAKDKDGDRGRPRKTLKQLRKEKDEDNEARALQEEMQQNFDAARAMASETEQGLYRELEEDMYS